MTSNELITNQPSGFPPLRAALPALVVQVLIGMLIAGAFVGLYVGLQRDPEPHGLPIAVVGAAPADAVAEALGDRARILPADDLAAAERLVRTHEAVALLAPTDGGWALATAGADGRSATGAATALATAIADRTGGGIVSTTDLVPLPRTDAQGLSGFYLVFATTLAGFIVAQVMASTAGLARLRLRLAVMGAGSVATAAVAAVLAGPVYGAVPAPTGAVVLVLSLLGAAVSLATLAVARLIGPLGNIVSTLLFTTLGNATSGATISSHLLPPFLAAVGAALPPGAAFRAVVDLGYYDGRGAAGPVLVLVAWIAGSGLLLLLAQRLRPAA